MKHNLYGMDRPFCITLDFYPSKQKWDLFFIHLSAENGIFKFPCTRLQRTREPNVVNQSPVLGIGRSRSHHFVILLNDMRSIPVVSLSSCVNVGCVVSVYVRNTKAINIRTAITDCDRGQCCNGGCQETGRCRTRVESVTCNRQRMKLIRSGLVF